LLVLHFEMSYTPSTLKPDEVAHAMVQLGIKKHKDRYENLFIKAFLAGAMLSFGGLLSEILSAGAAGLTATNPGIVKVLGGFVFPVGLVMIVLQGQELLTSNMMIFPMAVAKRAVPWWSLPLNWLIGMFSAPFTPHSAPPHPTLRSTSTLVIFTHNIPVIVTSFLWKPYRQPLLRRYPRQM
jgi:hypothetical protein